MTYWWKRLLWHCICQVDPGWLRCMRTVHRRMSRRRRLDECNHWFLIRREHFLLAVWKYQQLSLQLEQCLHHRLDHRGTGNQVRNSSLVPDRKTLKNVVNNYPLDASAVFSLPSRRATESCGTTSNARPTICPLDMLIDVWQFFGTSKYVTWSELSGEMSPTNNFWISITGIVVGKSNTC